MTKSAHPAKTKVYLLLLNNFSIFDQLQLEEALLRADDRNWCILNCGSSPAIVMGISGVQEKLVNICQLTENPVPVIRRFSGGGTVFIDPDTVFATWICNSADTDVSCCPQKIHTWTAEFYKKAFPMLGMHLRENDYVIGERKWGGNAQYLCKNRWLHHTSMLWDYDPKNMKYLLMPAKIPAYRQGREHDEFLCSLKAHFFNRQHVKEVIVDALASRFDVEEFALKDIAEVLERPHRKATKLQ
ncbi:MAG TPA: lipoate--protein ligase family protein [Parachlamydiaceae bacterium]|nr:lipoate--protein ligase family protein [Parachlamydiaceae bacterium]